jgi:isopenicillin N synthase-like dioxygenase
MCSDMGNFDSRPAREGEIPIIDMAPLLAGTAAGERQVGAAVARACEDVGFFYLVGHGVPAGSVADAFSAAHDFFTGPEAARLAVRVDGSQRGYMPDGAVTLPGNLLDVKEVFDLGVDLAPDDPDVRAGKPLLAPNRWPELNGFRPAVEAYFAAVRACAHELLRAFALGLDLEPTFFQRLCRRPLVPMRLVRYPPLPTQMVEGRYSVAAHGDYGLLTLLAQDDRGGLQIKSRAGEWIAAPCVADAFVVNIGDMMACWTNDRFTSTPHRVVSLSGADLYSIPLFYNPGFDCIVDTLPSCVSAETPRRYPPMRCGDYLLQRYDSTFADRRAGAEAG